MIWVSDVALADEQDAVQLIVDVYYRHGASWIAFTPEQLGDEFFELRTGRAGAITQKFVAYQMGLAVVGDITDRVAKSASLADWVRESNRGTGLWFVDDLDELAGRLVSLPLSGSPFRAENGVGCPLTPCLYGSLRP